MEDHRKCTEAKKASNRVDDDKQRELAHLFSVISSIEIERYLFVSNIIYRITIIFPVKKRIQLMYEN